LDKKINKTSPPLGGGGPDLHVCLTPALIPLYQVEDYIVVIIDIFRATSSICYGIENGAEAIIPVAEVEECAAYREKGLCYLLAAERNGEVVAGFDFGNSRFLTSKKSYQVKQWCLLLPTELMPCIYRGVQKK
jgi:2-phosphosulfolactate phosphatase